METQNKTREQLFWDLKHHQNYKHIDWEYVLKADNKLQQSVLRMIENKGDIEAYLLLYRLLYGEGYSV